MRMLKKVKKGLYDPSNEKDSCGIGFVANIYDISSRSIIDNALQILCNLTHRGAVSTDPRAETELVFLHKFLISFSKRIVERQCDPYQDR